jgi:hypothetical protein
LFGFVAKPTEITIVTLVLAMPVTQAHFRIIVVPRVLTRDVSVATFGAKRSGAERDFIFRTS